MASRDLNSSYLSDWAYFRRLPNKAPTDNEVPGLMPAPELATPEDLDPLIVSKAGETIVIVHRGEVEPYAGPPPTAYDLRYTDGAVGDIGGGPEVVWVELYDITPSQTVTFLQPATTYWFQTRARNRIGVGPWPDDYPAGVGTASIATLTPVTVYRSADANTAGTSLVQGRSLSSNASIGTSAGLATASGSAAAITPTSASSAGSSSASGAGASPFPPSAFGENDWGLSETADAPSTFGASDWALEEAV
jgi:hypothetical protein